MKTTTMLAAAGLLLGTSVAQASIYPYNYAEASYDWVNAYGTDIDAAGGSAELSHPICPHLLVRAHYNYVRSDTFGTAPRGYFESSEAYGGLSYVHGVLRERGVFNGLDVLGNLAYEYLDHRALDGFEPSNTSNYGSGYRIGVSARARFFDRLEIQPSYDYVHVNDVYGGEVGAQLRGRISEHVWVVTGYTHNPEKFYWNAGLRVYFWSASADYP